MLLGSPSAHLKAQEKNSLQGHSDHLLKTVSHTVVARLMFAYSGWVISEFLYSVCIPSSSHTTFF